MNRTTQKELLSDILNMIADLKDELANKESEVEAIFDQISQLGDSIYNLAQVDEWDEEELKTNIIRAIVDESQMEEIHDMLYSFQSDLNEYMEEISETKRESLEERYADLETVLEMMQYDDTDETLENVLDRVIETEQLIKEMKK